jgi:hypothetical protein
MDNGLGMTEEVRGRAFEPFFSTKKEKGKGLGLSVAYGIISRHNGELAVESEPGKGTTFVVTLPVVSELESGKDEPTLPGRDDRAAEEEDEAKVNQPATQPVRPSYIDNAP